MDNTFLQKYLLFIIFLILACCLYVCPEEWTHDGSTPGLCYLDVSVPYDNIDMSSAQLYCQNLNFTNVSAVATLPIFKTEDEYDFFTKIAQ